MGVGFWPARPRWARGSQLTALSPQIIMVRLQRVTFLALHNYLGLTTELFNPVSARARGGRLLLEAGLVPPGHTTRLRVACVPCTPCRILRGLSPAPVTWHIQGMAVMEAVTSFPGHP